MTGIFESPSPTSATLAKAPEHFTKHAPKTKTATPGAFH
jgi:hypothetical protein